MKTDAATLAYRQLQPEQILAAVESVGFRCDGRLLALNSYENRVYQVGLEEAEPVVAKFYRPHRWADAAIQEEHDFAHELAAAEIPVVAPCRDPRDGSTLHFHHQFRFAVFPRCGGRAPELDDPEHLLQLGRFAGRLHAVGAGSRFQVRPEISIEVFGEESVRFLLDSGFIPADLALAYRTLTEDLLRRVQACFERAGDYRRIRLHGDCHAGNVLWRGEAPHFVDFDDARTAPAIQDIWMMLSGDRPRQLAQLAEIVEGYNEFHDFRPRELRLVEALRSLRILHHCAWLARRWDDPAFPHHFPWFNTVRYWGEHILQLREQLAALHEPPLEVQ